MVQSATLGNQNTLNVGAGSVNNQIVSVNINICGSTTPKQLDSILFNPTGTNILADVANAKLFYTGNNPAFSTAQQVFTTVNAPINNVAANNSLGFGNCAAPFNLTTGDNYFWLTYDIKTTGLGATPGDIVDADFLKIVLHGTCLPGGSISYGTPQSLPGGRLIGISYSYATYSVGTSYAGYTINDFIASVAVTSAAGNPLFNLEHDITSWAGCTGTAGQNCNRHSPHPPDYTLFAPVNLGVSKDRSLNLKFGQGVRTGTVADVISIAAGTWFSANYVRACIDFNGDGDFDDQYNGFGGIIYESINVPNAYPLSDNQGINGLFTTAGQFPPGKLGDDWNQWNIQVPNLGELPQVIGLSAGPATKLGSVRMRVREVWATGTFTPYSGHTYGETEDYDVALVDNCPAPGSKYCKWISGGPNPTDWMTAANWCPSIPTQYDTALISPNGDGNYPIITSNQNPVCATLRIFSGAKVTVDAADTLGLLGLGANIGKLKAYHNVEIGEALSTSAQLKVTSSYVDSVFTGLPSASGNAVISPFRNDKQDHKIQFIYSPTEQTVMGLKSGDLLNSITFYIRSTTALAAGNLGNFTVKIWQIDNIYTFPAILLPNTEVAVNNVAPTIMPSTGAVLPTTCFGRLCFDIPAIAANVTTPITINFTNRYLVNTSKYLCIEITRDIAFTAGVAYPVLYESSLLRNCLVLFNANNSISANSNASLITGSGTAPGNCCQSIMEY
nr:hypothetical protein [Bacteroidota bacterium]